MKNLILFLCFNALVTSNLFGQSNERGIPSSFKTIESYERNIVDNAAFIFEGIWMGDTTIYAPAIVSQECKSLDKKDWYQDVVSYHKVRVSKVFRGNLSEGEIIEILFLGGVLTL